MSRAVERLREFFARRGVSAGAGGLAALISANAVQAAPAGLAAAISAAALLGTAVSTTAVIAATKTIAMTTLQKTIITAALVAAAGAGIFETRQVAQLREQNQTLQQSQAPVAEQIQQLQRERDKQASQLASLREDNEQLNRNTAELLKLRGEIARLRDGVKHLDETKKTLAKLIQTSDDRMEMIAHYWAIQAKDLKSRVSKMPDKSIPELNLLSEAEWLSAAQNYDSMDDDEAFRRILNPNAEVKMVAHASRVRSQIQSARRSFYFGVRVKYASNESKRTIRRQAGGGVAGIRTAK